MRSTVRLFLLAAGTVALAGGCSDSTNGGGGGTPQGALTFLRLASTAPALCADSAGAWFTRDTAGQEQEMALVFPEPGSDCLGSTHDFLRLKLGKETLLRYPDGNLIANGDSVFISMRWVGNDSILFDLKPTGLIFDPAQPAELKIEYDEAGPDLDEDGDVDSDDDLVEDRLDIWRQERPGDDFFRVGTAKLEDSNEVEAKLNGFSRFALAY